MFTKTIRIMVVVSGVMALAATAEAQSVWGLHGPGGRLVQVTGPNSETTGFPFGPTIGGFAYNINDGRCETPDKFMPDIPCGDVAVDRATDTLWVTDGLLISNFSKDGTLIATFENPMQHTLTGLGWGWYQGLPVLFMTDGWKVSAVEVPMGKACGPCGGFALMPRDVVKPGFATDVDYDPRTDTLLFSNSDGTITNEYVEGGLGPYGEFYPPPSCGEFFMNLCGIAVDTCAEDALYLTDGNTVVRMKMGGGIDSFAEETFYSPYSYYTWPAELPISGLAFDASPITFGEPCSVPELLPVIGWNGQATSPNPDFQVTLDNAESHAYAFLLVASDYTIPHTPGVPMGLSVWPATIAMGPYEVSDVGHVTVHAPLPEGVGGIGLSAYAQWVVLGIDESFISPAIEMTFSLP